MNADAAIRRAGMLRVNTLQQLFTAAETLARFRGNRGESLVVLTNGGGAGAVQLSVMTPESRVGGGVRAQFDGDLMDVVTDAASLTVQARGENIADARTFVGSVERGERNVAVLSLRKIARALRTTPAVLLADGVGAS